jgi:hypothetical protein
MAVRTFPGHEGSITSAIAAALSWTHAYCSTPQQRHTALFLLDRATATADRKVQREMLSVLLAEEFAHRDLASSPGCSVAVPGISIQLVKDAKQTSTGGT